MGLRVAFISGFEQTFIQVDAMLDLPPSRLLYAQNALKKLVLLPIYLPLSLLRTIADLSMLIFLGIASLFFCCGKNIGEELTAYLGCLSGCLARLGWTPIRATYLFFRSLYGAIINPKHLLEIHFMPLTSWERPLFQVEVTRTREYKRDKTPPYHIRCVRDNMYPYDVRLVPGLALGLCEDWSTVRVPRFLKYEA